MWVCWILYCIIILQHPYWWIVLNCIVSITIQLVALQCIAVHLIALYFIALHSMSASLVGRVQRGVKETDRVTNQHRDTTPPIRILHINTLHIRILHINTHHLACVIRILINLGPTESDKIRHQTSHILWKSYISTPRYQPTMDLWTSRETQSTKEPQSPGKLDGWYIQRKPDSSKLNPHSARR